MKNASLVLNLVLLLAVGYLFFAHFSRGGSQVAGGTETAAGSGPMHIVYINTDTLLAKYDYFRERQQQLAQKEQTANAGLQARGQALEQEVAAAQRRAQSGNLAPREIQQMQQDLGSKQQKLLEDQQRLSQELMEETQLLQEELQGKIKVLLTQLQKEKGYDYILSYGPGTGVLMVNEALDITSEVLTRLNQ